MKITTENLVIVLDLLGNRGNAGFSTKFGDLSGYFGYS